MSGNDPSKKPIDEVQEILHIVKADVQEIKNDINSIKQYIRKIEIRKEIEEQESLKEENEYVKTSWW
jgi:deoxyribose-phosphate aldolase